MINLKRFFSFFSSLGCKTRFVLVPTKASFTTTSVNFAKSARSLYHMVLVLPND